MLKAFFCYGYMQWWMHDLCLAMDRTTCIFILITKNLFQMYILLLVRFEKRDEIVYMCVAAVNVVRED